jgi:hypothetical protein
MLNLCVFFVCVWTKLVRTPQNLLMCSQSPQAITPLKDATGRRGFVFLVVAISRWEFIAEISPDAITHF